MRWRYEAVHPSTTHALDLSCNQAGHTWAVGHQGQLYVHINHKGIRAVLSHACVGTFFVNVAVATAARQLGVVCLSTPVA